MIRKKNPITRLLLSLGLVAMTGCSDGVPLGETPVTPTDEWTVYFSRAISENVTVVLRCSDGDHYGELKPAANENTAATWVDGKSLSWKDGATVITFCPAVETLPETVDATKNIAYVMDYTKPETKPETFTLTHLMAQLEVHIKISDDAQHHYEPTGGIISLHTTAAVNYPEKKLDAPTDEKTSFSLGKFTKENGDESEENWVNTPQIVIPQTLVAGTQCLSFTAGDKTYTFTPDAPITLAAGKRTKLYLGVAYQNDYVTLDKEGVQVSGWNSSEIAGGEVKEQQSNNNN